MFLKNITFSLKKKKQKVVKLRFSPLKYFAKKVKTVKNLQLTKLYRNC